MFGWTASLLLLLPTVTGSEAAANLKAFPTASEGVTRFVLMVAKQDDEAAFKVELIVGKTVRVDSVNNFFFSGNIQEETIQGWGFTKFVVRELGPMGGTLIAADPNEPKVDRFVTLGGEPFFVRYNSRLPVVVYVPEGVQVRYRIWRAGPETRTMEKG